MRPKIATDRLLIAIKMLLRESDMNIVVQEPVTPESQIHGNLDVLTKSFRQRVQERRKSLTERAKPRQGNAYPSK